MQTGHVAAVHGLVGFLLTIGCGGFVTGIGAVGPVGGVKVEGIMEGSMLKSVESCGAAVVGLTTNLTAPAELDLNRQSPVPPQP